MSNLIKNRIVPCSLFVICVAHVALTKAETVDYQRDIAPIFQEHCVHCHGEDEAESKFRVDLRPRMLRGGDSGLAAIVPGKPQKSYLVELIKHLDEDRAMPPDDDKLSDEKIQRIERWIAEGAVWPGQMDATLDETSDHWAFQKVIRPDIPGDESQPIDAFLSAKLEANGLTFSSPAKPTALIRRASIVLTGLMPTASETRQFVDDYHQDADEAYEKLIERLLASPHFGERWAQHWLDVIRWAETNGSEANLYRKNAWIYRDYVVRAFNEDKPYDQFVREQIGGDSMGSGEATGFLVSGPHVPAATVGREPAAIRQARADRMDEIMQTVGTSIMGMTMGCARCHNHKFDPITITDYYAMTGIFQDIEFGSRFPEFSDDHPRRKRGDELGKVIESKRAELLPFGGWEENWGAYREWHFRPAKTKAIRIRFKSNYVGLDELEIFGPENLNQNLALQSNGTQLTGHPKKGVENRNPLNRITDGEYGTMAWRARGDKNDKPWVRLDFDKPVKVSRIRMSGNREYFYDTDYLEKKPSVPRYEFDMDVMDTDGQWKPWMGTWFVNKKLNEQHPQRKKLLGSVQQTINALAEDGPRPSFVGRLVEPAKTFVLHRGSPESPRDEVAPAGPAILGGKLGLTGGETGAKRRTEFAKWISHPDNPLTARVMANRIWHHVFGAGIVATTSDFGTAGAPPTHPELLDWLASELVTPTQTPNQTKPAPWSMKHMIRLMVMSDAFRQSSLPRNEALAVDAGAAMLWRFPPKRVEAEVIRDSILQASGVLNRKIGGRSYRIHNVKKTYAQWEVMNNHGPETWRRMIYQERMRRVDDQMFTAFDFPDCGQVRAKRPVSTTPLQALNLMNSPFVIDQAKRIATRAKAESKGASENESQGIAIDRCFQLLLGRSPDHSERTACLELADQEGLAMVCRALINSNEFAFLP